MDKSSNAQLVEFIESADPDTIWTLIEMMNVFWHYKNTIHKIKLKFTAAAYIPQSGTFERKELAKELAREIRYFGSNDIAYITRKLLNREPGVDYMEIVREVTEQLNDQLKKKLNVPRVGSLTEYEQTICEQLIQIQFQGKTEDEIALFLKESGLESDAAKHAAKEIAKFGIAGASLLSLVALIGKKAVTQVIGSVLVMLVTKILGKEAAERLAAALLKQLPQKIFSRLLGVVGWALLTWDVTVNLAGSAGRVTMPCVSLISAERCMKRLNAEDK